LLAKIEKTVGQREQRLLFFQTGGTSAVQMRQRHDEILEVHENFDDTLLRIDRNGGLSRLYGYRQQNVD
jgi:hypothetical protein